MSQEINGAAATRLRLSRELTMVMESSRHMDVNMLTSPTDADDTVSVQDEQLNAATLEAVVARRASSASSTGQRRHLSIPNGFPSFYWNKAAESNTDMCTVARIRSVRS